MAEEDFFRADERLNKIFEDEQSVQIYSRIGQWIPVMDIYETSDRFVIKLELPEVLESDIKIILEGNTIKIAGERRLKIEGRNYYQIERNYGKFFRSFLLPSDVDAQNIKATLIDGILKIVVPKKEQFLRHLKIVEDIG
jgi:HSP20 family protein